MVITHRSLKNLFVLSVTQILATGALAGTFSYSINTPTLSGSTQNVACDVSDGLTALLSVTATPTQTSTAGQASVPIKITYTPAAGETNLPTIAYVQVQFTNTFNLSSTSDNAAALDINDNSTVVDQIAPADFSLINGAGSNFGTVQVPVPLTIQPDGTLQGTYTAVSNKLTAGVPTGSSDVSQAMQLIYIDQIAASPFGSGSVRQASASTPRRYISVSPDSNTLTGDPNSWGALNFFSGSDGPVDHSKSNYGELDEWCKVVSSGGRGEATGQYCWRSASENITVSVLIKSPTAISSTTVTGLDNVYYTGTCNYSGPARSWGAASYTVNGFSGTADVSGVDPSTTKLTSTLRSYTIPMSPVTGSWYQGSLHAALGLGIVAVTFQQGGTGCSEYAYALGRQKIVFK